MRQISRLIDGRRVTFLANPTGEPIELRLRTTDVSPASETPTPLVAWDPVEVRTVPLPLAQQSSDGGDWYVFALPSFGSVFVLPASARPVAPLRGEPLPLEGNWELTLPGNPPFAMTPGPRLWTELEDARGFSGIGTYRLEIAMTAEQVEADRLLLDLGTVRDLARVTVNGADCGIAWTPPFRVDVTSALRPGGNIVEVEVATPWRNRIIAEAGAPSGRDPRADDGRVRADCATRFPPGCRARSCWSRSRRRRTGARTDQRDYCPT